MKNKAGAEVETVRAVLAATTEKHYKELMADKPMPLEPSQQDAKESIMALLKEQGPMAGMDLKKLVMDETGSAVCYFYFWLNGKAKGCDYLSSVPYLLY